MLARLVSGKLIPKDVSMRGSHILRDSVSSKTSDVGLHISPYPAYFDVLVVLMAAVHGPLLESTDANGLGDLFHYHLKSLCLRCVRVSDDSRLASICVMTDL